MQFYLFAQPVEQSVSAAEAWHVRALTLAAGLEYPTGRNPPVASPATVASVRIYVHSSLEFA